MAPMIISYVVMIIMVHLLSSTTINNASPVERPEDAIIALPSESINNKNNDLFCNSWKNGVETNAAVGWSIPAQCTHFAKTYMQGQQYESDLQFIASQALSFANSVNLTNRDVWIFDIDDTLLTVVPYHYADDQPNRKGRLGQGDHAVKEEYEYPSDMPALPATLSLYEQLKKLGFKIILLTGRSESLRALTEQNLVAAGFTNWERLILREACEEEKSAEVFKSEKRAELEYGGYTIQGNAGDQWSDLLGFAMAKRSFKLPNLMYYTA